MITMAATMTQLNTRLNADLKRGGDTVFARFGLTPSEVVRKVWQYAVDNQTVPEFMAPANSNDEVERKRKLAHESAGMAVRLAGFSEEESQALKDAWDETPWEDIRDEMYDSMIKEMEENHI